MRIVCTAYVGNMAKRSDLQKLAEDWCAEGVAKFDLHDSPGEFNSPTYAGITLFALSLAQYCPSDSMVAQVAPRLLTSIWTSIGKLAAVQRLTHRRSVQPVPAESRRTVGQKLRFLHDTSRLNVEES